MSNNDEKPVEFGSLDFLVKSWKAIFNKRKPNDSLSRLRMREAAAKVQQKKEKIKNEG